MNDSTAVGRGFHNGLSGRDRPYLFESHANPVLLDPEDSAVEHDATMLGHKLKPIGNVVRVRHIDSGPISGDIYDTTADAHPIATYSRGVIDFCPLPILGHDEPPCGCKIADAGLYRGVVKGKLVS